MCWGGGCLLTCVTCIRAPTQKENHCLALSLFLYSLKMFSLNMELSWHPASPMDLPVFYTPTRLWSQQHVWQCSAFVCRCLVLKLVQVLLLAEPSVQPLMKTEFNPNGDILLIGIFGSCHPHSLNLLFCPLWNVSFFLVFFIITVSQQLEAPYLHHWINPWLPTHLCLLEDLSYKNLASTVMHTDEYP